MAVRGRGAATAISSPADEHFARAACDRGLNRRLGGGVPTRCRSRMFDGSFDGSFDGMFEAGLNRRLTGANIDAVAMPSALLARMLVAIFFFASHFSPHDVGLLLVGRHDRWGVG